MRESCNPADITEEGEWETAAEWSFKINNWPYVSAENETVKKCFYTMNRDSPVNLAKD